MKFRRADGTFDVADLRARRRHRPPRAGDRRRPVELPDRGDRRQRARVPPARPRLREPRRVPDGQRHAVRLRRGPRHGGGDHGADDRPRLRAVGEDRRGDRARTSATRRTASRTTRSCACTATPRTRSRTRRCADTRAARRPRARSWEEAVELGEPLRLPQRAGDGARADGDDLVPDGLRHDRHRARLLARQVQGARRRRPDDDRQPHGAAGAADARLRRRADRADRGAHQRARHDRRRARPRRRAPAGVRRRGRRARDLAHGPHQDDGRGPAVHLGRDLQDGQHAERRRRSRTSPTPTSQAWRLGVKALAIYRDGSKTAQALRTDAQKGAKPRRVPRGASAPGAGRASSSREAVDAPPRREAGPRAQADAARAPVDHAQVLDRRPRGLHHRRHVRGRHASARSSSPTSARRARRCAA